ncbi:MAG: hypothetical protein HGA45_14560 [Chloroflexales bacterium]|nr:hypothetical protein [Chloroflexales bacterium]
MAPPPVSLDVYLEIGAKRTFACALDWPGWCRVGRDEGSALLALVASGPRYASVLQTASLAFDAPADVSALAVVERLDGTTTTDFGAPDVAPAADLRPLDDSTLERLQTVLKACWQALDTALHTAAGKDLRKGPRGGGRDLDAIAHHLLGADKAYLARLASKLPKQPEAALSEELDRTRQAILGALAAAARGDLPAQGPRGGTIWPPRYFARRVAWHALDHTWEIEDRLA